MANFYRFENVLLDVGAGFKWHLVVFCIASFPEFFSAFFNFSTLILFYTPEHWCRVPHLDAAWGANWTLARIRDFAIPRTADDVYSRCEMYDRDYSAALSAPWMPDISLDSNLTSNGTEALIKCSSWIYDDAQMTKTVVTDWNLVCNATHYASIGKSAYMVGMFFGSVGFGYMSDRYGRRRAVFIAVVQYVTCALLSTFAPTYWIYVVLRTLTGMAAIGAYLCAFVLLNETVLPKYRGMMSTGIHVFAAVGVMITSGLIYVSRGNWKTFNLVSTVGLLTMLSYYWIFPESPRWLILENRLDEALTVVRRIANMSGRRDISDEHLTSIIKKCRREAVLSADDAAARVGRAKWRLVLDIMTSPALRVNTIICCFLWVSVSFGYYGIMFASPKFATSLSLVVFVGGLVSVPTGILGVFLIKMMSRRAVLSWTFSAAGLCSLAFFFVPQEYRWLQSTVGMTGKLAVSLTFSAVYILTAELFPTDHRNVAMGVGSTFGRIGSVIAPFVVDVLGSEYIGNAMAVFGVELLLASLASLLVKETADKSLPETEMDVKNFDNLDFKEQAETRRILK